MNLTLLQGVLSFCQAWRAKEVAERVHPGNFNFARRVDNRIFVYWERELNPVLSRHSENIASFYRVRGCRRS